MQMSDLYERKIENLYTKFKPELILGDFQSFAELITCSSCKFIVEEPLCCNSCKALICYSCFNQQNENIKCSSQCDTFKPVQVTPTLVSIISIIKLKCPLGCDKQSTLLNTKYHILQCPNLLYKCLACDFESNLINIRIHVESCQEFETNCEECGIFVKKSNYYYHIDNECINRQVVCKDCNSIYTLSDKHDQDVCIMRLKDRNKNLDNDLSELKDHNALMYQEMLVMCLYFKDSCKSSISDEINIIINKYDIVTVGKKYKKNKVNYYNKVFIDITYSDRIQTYYGIKSDRIIVNFSKNKYADRLFGYEGKITQIFNQILNRKYEDNIYLYFRDNQYEFINYLRKDDGMMVGKVSEGIKFFKNNKKYDLRKDDVYVKEINWLEN